MSHDNPLTATEIELRWQEWRRAQRHEDRSLYLPMFRRMCSLLAKHRAIEFHWYFNSIACPLEFTT